MYANKDNKVPACPACGANHYPCELGDGTHQWCDGRKAIYADKLTEEKIPEGIKGILFDGEEIIIPDSF